MNEKLAGPRHEALELRIRSTGQISQRRGALSHLWRGTTPAGEPVSVLVSDLIGGTAAAHEALRPHLPLRMAAQTLAANGHRADALSVAVKTAQFSLAEALRQHRANCPLCAQGKCPEVANVLAFLAHGLGATLLDLAVFSKLVAWYAAACGPGCCRFFELEQTAGGYRPKESP